MIFLKSNISYGYRKKLLIELNKYKKRNGLSIDPLKILKEKDTEKIGSLMIELEKDKSIGHNFLRLQSMFQTDDADSFRRSVNTELSFIKEFESFENKINFEKFTPFYDFRRLLYQNNPQLLENIYFKNKKVIPTYLSTIFTELFFKGVLSTNISRLHVENYFLSVMRNMDYKNFFSIKNLPKEAFDGNLKSFTLIQSSFHKALGPHMDTLYKYRMQTLKEKTQQLEEEIGIKVDSASTITYFFEPVQELFVNQDHYNSACKVFSDNMNSTYQPLKTKLSKSETKTTAANVFQYFEQIKLLGKNKEGIWFNENGYNVVLVTNTFCIPKLCHEVEKYLFRNPKFPKPANILVFGNETFYQLYSHDEFTSKQGNTILNFPDDTESLKKLRIQSFMYEMFMHALDRNNHND